VGIGIWNDGVVDKTVGIEIWNDGVVDKTVGIGIEQGNWD
jgi:hypothetical protein